MAEKLKFMFLEFYLYLKHIPTKIMFDGETPPWVLLEERKLNISK